MGLAMTPTLDPESLEHAVNRRSVQPSFTGGKLRARDFSLVPLAGVRRLLFQPWVRGKPWSLLWTQ